jgi:hypothetical protein
MNCLDNDNANYYQSLIGILHWVVNLEDIDIAFGVSTIAQFNCNPRTGHLRNTLKGSIKSKLVMDCRKRDMDQFGFPEDSSTQYYPGAAEVIPDNMPCPLGETVKITVFYDALFAANMVRRKSVTGILIFINGLPILWLSERQATLKTSTFGSEFVALRVAVEMVEVLHYKLRMFGVPLDGPANAFCDSQSVVLNSTLPLSTLKKKHNSVNYHKVCSCIAAGTICVTKEPGETNTSDFSRSSWLRTRRANFQSR